MTDGDWSVDPRRHALRPADAGPLLFPQLDLPSDLLGETGLVANATDRLKVLRSGFPFRSHDVRALRPASPALPGTLRVSRQPAAQRASRFFRPMFRIGSLLLRAHACPRAPTLWVQ